MSKFAKFILIIFLLLLYTFLRYLLPINNIWGFNWLINPLIYLLIAFLAFKLFPGDSLTRDKKTRYKTIFILTALYLIVFLLFGLFLTFERNIYWGRFLLSIQNFYHLGSVIILIEIIRFKLVNNGPKKKMFGYIIIILTYYLMNLDSANFLSNFKDFATATEFILTGMFVPILKEIVFTYIIVKSGRNSLLIHRLLILTVFAITPVFPKMDWFMLSMFDTIWYVAFYIVISYEAVSLDRDARVKEIKRERPYIYIVLLSILIIFVCFQLGFFKYVPIGIVTRSMYPVFSRGDAVIIEKLNEKTIKELEINDIIEYRTSSRSVVHRIIDIDKTDVNNWIFTTMGDNNNGPDFNPVEEHQIKGIVRMRIPYVGYPSVYFTEFFDRSTPDDIELGD